MALARPLGSSAASSSGGASHPAKEEPVEPEEEPARGASQPASLTVASFNFGFLQQMMTGKNATQHCTNLGASAPRSSPALTLMCCLGARSVGFVKA